MYRIFSVYAWAQKPCPPYRPVGAGLPANDVGMRSASIRPQAGELKAFVQRTKEVQRTPGQGCPGWGRIEHQGIAMEGRHNLPLSLNSPLTNGLPNTINKTASPTPDIAQKKRKTCGVRENSFAKHPVNPEKSC